MLTTLVIASALTLAADNRQMRAIEALIHVDKSGKVQQLEWLHPEQVSDPISTYLKPNVLAVEFEPAQKNGVATDSELLIKVVVEADERPDGLSDVRIVSVEKATPRMVNAPMARYPQQMLRQGTSAFVLLSVEIGADGRAIENSIALAGEADPESAAKVRHFFRSARQVVSKAHFEHLENVGGVQIGGTFNIPFVFCVNNCDAIKAEVAKLRAAQVLMPSPSADVKFASIKLNPIPKPAAGS